MFIHFLQFAFHFDGEIDQRSEMHLPLAALEYQFKIINNGLSYLLFYDITIPEYTKRIHDLAISFDSSGIFTQFPYETIMIAVFI